MNKKLFSVVITLLLNGCATNSALKDEGAEYMKIKAIIARDRYSLAYLEMMKFEESYPKSQFLCEFYSFRIAYAMRYGLDAQRKKYEITYNEKCK